ncbi:MAG: ISKra4 family transposase [Chroococcidiopsidaceae cyanobacterium CP_BM_RX_35]|nr:ISKra4 family transposase [Chroococcidiopsidaceae cyanobacterium CP_BM_RX_35]
MDYELRIVVEKVSVSSQEVVNRDTLKVYDMKAPASILELGLRHEEQISLLEKVQNSVLAAQSKLINTGYDVCPKCSHKLNKMGHTKSNFHAVFTDHQVGIQKHKCRNPECDWQSTPTTTSVFGTSIHPDLAKLQCEQGALYSYRQAQSNLEKLTVYRRPVNNHNNIKLIATQVGAVISEENLKSPAAGDCAPPATEVIVQVDGGYIPIKERDKRSFEALSGVVYRPESICTIDQHHRQINSKSFALSAQDDDLTTMKIYLLNAALKQGMKPDTVVTALADGACNCWSVILSLTPHCQQLLCILDWFHIAQKFQNVRGAVEDAYTETLERVKWTLWHGKPDEALSKLQLLMTNTTDSKKRRKLADLYDYLNRNQAYLVNYREREQQGHTYTSQVAESHIESIINARHKKSGKMQWTREGAHNVLQIRGKIASNEWGDHWQEPVLSALGVIA